MAVLYIHVHKIGKGRFFLILTHLFCMQMFQCVCKYVLMQEYKHSYKDPPKLCDKLTFFFV